MPTRFRGTGGRRPLKAAPHTSRAFSAPIAVARPRRHALSALVAAAVVLTIIASVLVATRGSESSRPASAKDFVHGTWRALAAGPATGIGHATTIWTGKELIVWGRSSSGEQVVPPEPSAYNPRTDEWRRLDPPVSVSIAPVWTGRELIVWAGLGPTDFGFRGSSPGAAYNPTTDKWHRIATAPLEPAVGSTAVWTGREVVVLVGGGMSATAAAAYDPRTNTWRRLPDLPRSLDGGGTAVAWDGSEVVLAWGSCCDAAAFAYSPQQDAWREIAPPPPAVSNGGLVRTKHGLIGVGFASGPDPDALRIAAYELRSELSWQAIANARPVPFICHARPTVVSDGVFVSCPEPSEFLGLDDRMWRAMPQPPRPIGATVWTGKKLLGLSVDGSRLLEYRPAS